MKKYFSFALFGLLMTFVLTSCQKEEVVAPIQSFEGKGLTQHQKIVAFLAQSSEFKNNGNGAVIVEPLNEGVNFSIFRDMVIDPMTFLPVSGQLGGFEAVYDQNDFWVMNPDGTTNITLTSNDCYEYYQDFGTGELYSGTGHCNVNYTGQLTTIQIPFPPFEIYVMFLTTETAVSVHAQANVTLNGQPGPSKKFRMQAVTTPSGENNVDFSLK